MTDVGVGMVNRGDDGGDDSGRWAVWVLGGDGDSGGVSGCSGLGG